MRAAPCQRDGTLSFKKSKISGHSLNLKSEQIRRTLLRKQTSDEVLRSLNNETQFIRKAPVLPTGKAFLAQVVLDFVDFDTLPDYWSSVSHMFGLATPPHIQNFLASRGVEEKIISTAPRLKSWVNSSQADKKRVVSNISEKLKKIRENEGEVLGFQPVDLTDKKSLLYGLFESDSHSDLLLYLFPREVTKLDSYENSSKFGRWFWMYGDGIRSGLWEISVNESDATEVQLKDENGVQTKLMLALNWNIEMGGYDLLYRNSVFQRRTKNFVHFPNVYQPWKHGRFGKGADCLSELLTASHREGYEIQENARWFIYSKSDDATQPCLDPLQDVETQTSAKMPGSPKAAPVTHKPRRWEVINEACFQSSWKIRHEQKRAKDKLRRGRKKGQHAVKNHRKGHSGSRGEKKPRRRKRSPRNTVL